MSASIPRRRPDAPAVVRAGLLLLADLLSSLVFAAVFALTHAAVLATLLGVGAGLVQAAVMLARRRRIDLMQWTSLALVVVFGGASLILRDPRVMMVKPTVIYLAVAAAMLKPHWMVRYLPETRRALLGDVADLFGHAWAALMAGAALVNLAVALARPALWPAFIALVPAAKAGLFLVQYAVMSRVGRARSRASLMVNAAPAR